MADGELGNGTAGEAPRGRGGREVGGALAPGGGGPPLPVSFVFLHTSLLTALSSLSPLSLLSLSLLSLSLLSLSSLSLSSLSSLSRQVLYEPFATWLNFQLTPLAEAITERDVIPTYAFPILYTPGGHVAAHRDVHDNYYSLTLSVESSLPDQQLRSGLVFVDTMTNTVDMEDPDTKAYRLEPGINQGVFYIGPELIHWREPVPPGHHLAQVVFAFRPVSDAACVSQ